MKPAVWNAFAQWAAIAFALVGAGWTWRRARTADMHAADANRLSQESVEAQQRMAAAAEKRIAALQPQADRVVDGGTAVPRADWHLQWIGGDKYRLRNVGDAPATNLRVQPDDAYIWAGNEDMSHIEVLESRDLVLTPSMAVPSPGELSISWDEHPDSVIVPLPM
jgi:hypothetical protein